MRQVSRALINQHWSFQMPQSGYARKYLVSPSTERSDGVGPVVELGALHGTLLVESTMLSNRKI
jgi:hypothetical protein